MSSWALSEVFIVYHGSTAIGIATNLVGDQPWIHADFKPSAAANAYQDFLDACTEDDSDLPEPGHQYPESYFDDSMWSVEDEKGHKRGIFLPAVHWNDGAIAWRWREEGD